jgi:quercetin dioxygenase-like cupin family protein
LELSEFAKQYVVRFDELKPTAGAPPDAQLPRFKRDRLLVLGRASERRGGDTGPVLNAGINLAYVRCEPGKGFCSHKHPDWEIFVALSGTWKILIEDDTEHTITALDVVAVPGNTFHGAVNVGDTNAYMMSINMGSDTARYTIAPAIVEELRRLTAAPLEAATEPQ